MRASDAFFNTELSVGQLPASPFSAAFELCVLLSVRCLVTNQAWTVQTVCELSKGRETTKPVGSNNIFSRAGVRNHRHIPL